MNDDENDEYDRRCMAEIPTERTWRVAPYEGYGPVVMTLRVPEVKITDSAGRFIIISPKQTEMVSARLENIGDWLQHGVGDWFPEGEEGAGPA